MSAPDTNVEKQEENHKPALGGIGFAMIWGLVLLAGLVAFTILNGDDPVGADEQVDGRDGTIEVVPTE